MSIRSAVVGTAAGLVFILGATVSPALTLADVVAGASIQSNDGSLTFSNFEASVGGAMRSNLAKYRIEVTDDGFYIAGRKRGDGRGRLNVSFDVTANAIAGTTLTPVITGSTLGLSVRRRGHGRAEQTLFDGLTQISDIGVADGAGHGLSLNTSSFPGVPDLHADVVMVLKNGTRRFILLNAFEVVPKGGVPEPAMGGLLLIGGLALLRRRR